MSQRAIYERQRRRRLAEDRKAYRVLFPWLRKTHPEVFMQFSVFFGKLGERNPKSKNLSVTRDFRRFMWEGKGMCYVFCLVLCCWCYD